MHTILFVIAGILIFFWLLGLVRRVFSWALHILLLLAVIAVVIGLVLHG